MMIKNLAGCYARTLSPIRQQ